jgi:tetratricopeptide (TPR) repeat protein
VDLGEKAYRVALDRDAGRLFAANNLAMILARSGRADEALPLARRLVAQRDDVAEFCDTLAFVQEARGDYAGAEKALERCLQIEPGHAPWAIRIVRLMLRQGHRDRAVQAFETFRRRYPAATATADLRDDWADVERALRQAD